MFPPVALCCQTYILPYKTSAIVVHAKQGKAVKAIFINALSGICRKVGADIDSAPGHHLSPISGKMPGPETG